MKPKKTTQRDFEVFKAEVSKLLKKYHVIDWRIRFSMEEMPDNNAECCTRVIYKTCLFRINTNIYLYSDEEIRQIALHEVCHLLIADISDLAYIPFKTEDQVEQATETVAHRIGNLLTEFGAAR